MLLGLNEKEAEVYLALLALGKATAYAIAKRSGLKRPTVYMILDQLRQKEVVLKIPNAKKQLFIAKDPSELGRIAEDRLSDARRGLREISALTHGRTESKILYFEGGDEIAELLNYRLTEMVEKEFVGFYAYTENDPKKTLHSVNNYNETLRRLNIHTRGIVPNHPSLNSYRASDATYLREMKVVQQTEYSSRMMIDAGDTFVRIISFSDQQGIVIDNPHVAKSFRQIFEMAWKK
jgi:sugar-specific transcriptional regulator TrmB